MDNDMNAIDRAIKVFEDHHGILRTQQAIRYGIAPRTLYEMHAVGLILRESRGLYRLADTEINSNTDLIHIGLRIPKAVICLISALSFHNLTTQVPHQVYIALPIDAEKPRLEYPPLRIFWLSARVYVVGIETHELDGIPVKIYTIEKTIADCFKFRNKIGMDVALEALKKYRKTDGFKIDTLLNYARIDRVEKLIRPYLEAIL
jgi:predicted transcriptional regulator of viral defense system